MMIFKSLMYKYKTTLAARIVYAALCAVMLVLVAGYLREEFRINLILRFVPHFYQYVSNLFLSLLFYLAIGTAWMLLGRQLQHVLLLGIGFAAVNIIGELPFMRFMHTPDIIDMFFGLFGTALGILYFIITYNHGLIPLTPPA